MGTITTGIGLISGIDTASLIDSLITLESRGKFLLQQRVTNLRAQQTALLDINSRLLGFRTNIKSFRTDSIFRKALTTTSNENILTAIAGTGTSPGSYKFIVNSLATTSQQLSRGFATRDATPLGLTTLGFEFGQGALAPDTRLELLNGGNGVSRGSISITDRDGNQATVDLTDVTTFNEVIDRINATAGVDVTASVQGDHLVITDNTSGLSTLTVANVAGFTTASDLGIATADGGAGDGDAVANGVIQGADINTLGLNTALSTLNDGNGVLILDNVPDIQIRAKDLTLIDVDFGRVNAPITDDTLLADLNDGEGITINAEEDDPDIRVIANNSALDFEIDLTGVTTVGQLRTRIEQETGGIVKLNILDGERFQVESTSGGGAALQILGAGPNGTETAEDLGILDESPTIISSTHDGTLIQNLATTPPAQTIGDVIDRINDAELNQDAGLPEGRKITASLAPDGVSLLLTDHTGAGSGMRIRETAANTQAVHDLGIYLVNTAGTSHDGERIIASLNSVMVSNLNGGNGVNVIGTVPLDVSAQLSDLPAGAGLSTNGNTSSPDIFIQDRDGLTYQVEVDGLSTVQDLIDAFDTATGGVVTLSVNGQSLRVENFSAGLGNFQVTDLNGASVASELGIVGDLTNPDGDIIDGIDTQPDGPVTGTTFNITDRNGNNVVIGSIDTYISLSEIIDQINQQAATASVQITAGINAAGNGLLITDASGGSGNLIVTDSAAVAFGIDTGAAGLADDEVVGSNLQHQYVSEATKLSDLNYGRGVGTGGIKITDGLGNTASINIGTDAETVHDVIAEINAITSAKNVKVNARINDQGDGIIIESTYDPTDTPFIPLKIEAAGGTIAAGLNLVGESDTIDNASIDGTYEQVVEFAVTDTLDDVVQKLLDSGVPVSATVINTGSPAAPYRLSITSDISGAPGEMIIDTGDFDLGLTSLARGVDAKIFFGGDVPEDGFLITSSSNSFTDVIPGLTIDLVAASDEAVTIEVQRDIDTIVESVSQLTVTFNDVIGRIDDFDFFNTETESRGVLLGDPTTSQVRSLMFRTLSKRVENVDTQYQFLHQVGITAGAGGQIGFDEQKFRDAYENDRVAVEKLFLALKADTESNREILPGVTVTESSTTTTARGIVAIFEDLMTRLIDPVDGLVTRADTGFDTRIEQFEDRIEVLDERLEARRTRLQAQFLAMELSLAKLQGQSSALLSLSLNLPSSVF